MSKKYAPAQTKEKPLPAQSKSKSSFSSFKVQAVILAIICFIFYGNTFNNDYALDDELVITHNEYTQQGFEGIPKILTTSAYDSYVKQTNHENALSAGRYRPFSVVTFAIEQQLFGTQTEITSNQGSPQPDVKLAHTQHFVNVLLYICSVIALLYLLRNIIFPTEQIIAFLAALLFAIHPVHTEVVANIKSRDEILSLLFICLTFIYAWKYAEVSKPKNLVLALSFYFLALLSKEYAVTLIVLIPLFLYLFKKYGIAHSLKATLPYLGILVVYFLIRYSIAPAQSTIKNHDILNDPYLYATAGQKIATIIATQIDYIRLLLLPHPLSSDYAYAQIPYVGFSNPLVWLSAIVYVTMLIVLIRLIQKRHVLAFAIACCLVNWLLISNLFFETGATIGERLIYHASIGFAIVLAYYLYKGYEKLPSGSRRSIGIAMLLVIISLTGFATIQRNKDWKDNFSLFSKDVQTCPNSATLNAGMGNSYAALANTENNNELKDQYFKSAIQYWTRALEIHQKYVLCYVNRASAYLQFKEYGLAQQDLDSVKKYDPAFPNLQQMYSSLYFKKATKFYAPQRLYKEAIVYLNIAAKDNPTDPKLWYYMGNYYAELNQYDSSLYAFYNASKYRPGDPEIQHLIDNVKRISNNSNAANK